jgi:hypothetical protein
VVLDNLHVGEVRLAVIAKALRLSARTVQRRLQEQALEFNALVDDDPPDQSTAVPAAVIAEHHRDRLRAGVCRGEFVHPGVSPLDRADAARLPAALWEQLTAGERASVSFALARAYRCSDTTYTAYE